MDIYTSRPIDFEELRYIKKFNALMRSTCVDGEYPFSLPQHDKFKMIKVNSIYTVGALFCSYINLV